MLFVIVEVFSPKRGKEANLKETAPFVSQTPLRFVHSVSIVMMVCNYHQSPVDATMPQQQKPIRNNGSIANWPGDAHRDTVVVAHSHHHHSHTIRTSKFSCSFRKTFPTARREREGETARENGISCAFVFVAAESHAMWRPYSATSAPRGCTLP